jgi:transposase
VDARKLAALGEAPTGRVTVPHRFLLAQLLHHVEFLNDAIATCDRHIATLTAADGDALARLDTIPGVARRTAETVLAELGGDMSRFPTAGHAASWAGLCPGNHESAGKRLSGRTRFANRSLRQALVESPRRRSQTRLATSRRSTTGSSSAVATRGRSSPSRTAFSSSLITSCATASRTARSGATTSSASTPTASPAITPNGSLPSATP